MRFSSLDLPELALDRVVVDRRLRALFSGGLLLTADWLHDVLQTMKQRVAS